MTEGAQSAAIATTVSHIVIANLGQQLEEKLNNHRVEMHQAIETQLRGLRNEVAETLTREASKLASAQGRAAAPAPESVEPASVSSACGITFAADAPADATRAENWRKTNDLTRAPDEEEVQVLERLRLEKEKALKQREHFMQHFSSDELFGIGASSGHGAGPSNVPKSIREAIYGDGDECDWFETPLRLGRFIAPKLLISPSSTFRSYWDAVSVCLVLFMAAVLPYRICFALEWSLTFSIIDFMSDLYFLFDLVLNFFTCYMNRDGELIASYKLIAYHYARSWLLPDLIASIPFDWFMYGLSFSTPEYDAQTYQIARGVEALRLLRLLRVARLYRFLERYEDRLNFMNSNIFRLLNVIAVMAFFAHWNGCFQYLLATVEAEWVYDEVRGNRTIVFNPDSWVARLQADGVLDEQNAWSWSYFNAISQMLAISTGIKAPRRRVELWGYLASILMGACLYGFFVASLTTAISEADASAKDYRTKLDMVQQYMKHVRLPRTLRNKLMAYFELRFPSKRSFDELGIMSEISTPMRQEIALHKCHTVLSTLQVLHAGVPGLAGAISQQLERVVFVAGDHIVRSGEESSGMYFISSGLVVVVGSKGEEIKTLGASSFFGEMALLNPEGRSVASIIVKTYCEGYRLSVESYDKIVFSYPTFKEYLESAAKLRLKAAAKANPPRSSKGEALTNLAAATSLDEMFDNLNPMKRKLNQQSQAADRRKQRNPIRHGQAVIARLSSTTSSGSPRQSSRNVEPTQV